MNIITSDDLNFLFSTIPRGVILIINEIEFFFGFFLADLAEKRFF